MRVFPYLAGLGTSGDVSESILEDEYSEALSPDITVFRQELTDEREQQAAIVGRRSDGKHFAEYDCRAAVA